MCQLSLLQLQLSDFYGIRSIRLGLEIRYSDGMRYRWFPQPNRLEFLLWEVSTTLLVARRKEIQKLLLS